MKKWKRLLVILLSASFLGIAFSLRKVGWESDFNRPWQVDIDASVKRIDAVPDRYQSRFKALDDYKNFVRGRANGLRLVLYKNGTAAMTGGWSGGTKARWKEDKDFDYWIHTGNVFVTGVGHGFDRTSARSARLKFQLEWDENVATREFLILRRK
jgi:hypothetical protein